MAILVKGKTFASGEVVTPQKLHELLEGPGAGVSDISNADIAANASIAASKLASTLNLSASTITLPAGQALSYPVLTGVREAVVTISGSGTQTLNLQSGNIFQITPTGNITIAFSNPPAIGTFVGVLIRHQGNTSAYTYTWPSNTKWAYGEPAPTMTSTSGKFDLISMFTYDGGNNWFAQVIGQNY
jgi:hypothetical protein